MTGTYYATTTEQLDTKFFTFTVQNTDPLVSLVPKSEGKIIDVVNDFAWSASPKLQGSFKKVPVMYLQEREQVQNSLLSSAFYYLNSIGEFDIGSRDGNTIKGINDNIKSLLTKLDDITRDAFGNDIARYTTGVGLDLQAGLEAVVKQNVDSDKALLKDKLRSYLGIYLTKPTGFNYALPFFNQTPLGIESSWSAESQLLNNPAGGVINAGLGLMERAAYMLNITQPGTFIEKPKFFQYATVGDTVTVSFPLFNTIKRSQKIPYQQNYELLWILAFQNKPYRTSFSRISPPKLYTLTIPGQKYMPYCYISKMDINFGGTRRNLPVSIPSPNSMFGAVGPALPDFNTVDISIPDVYMVSITFTSLLADVANTMVDNGFTSSRISVGTVPSTRDTSPAPVEPPAPVVDRVPPIPSPPNAALVAADRERAEFATNASANTDEFFRRQRDLEGARRLINDFTTLPPGNTAQRPNITQSPNRRVEFVTRD